MSRISDSTVVGSSLARKYQDRAYLAIMGNTLAYYNIVLFMTLNVLYDTLLLNPGFLNFVQKEIKKFYSLSKYKCFVQT